MEAISNGCALKRNQSTGIPNIISAGGLFLCVQSVNLHNSRSAHKRTTHLDDFHDMTQPQRGQSLKVAVALLTVYLVWGSTYLAIRIGLDGWPPFLLAATRFITAGLLLLMFGFLRHEPLPTAWLQWRTLIITGVLMLTIGNACVVWAELYVASGMVAVIVGTASLWMMLLDAMRPKGERMTWAKLAGAILGLAGVAVLMAPQLANGGNDHALWGQLVLLGGSLSWAFGSVYSKHAPMPRSNVVGSGVQMLVAGFVLFVLATATGELASFDGHRVLGAPLWAVSYLITFGSCVAFTAYSWLLRHTGPALASTYAYVNPVVAVLLGTMLRHEPVTHGLLLGSALVLLSVFAIQRARVKLAAQLAREARSPSAATAKEPA